MYISRYVAGYIYHKSRALPTPQSRNQQGTCLACAGWPHYKNVPFILLRGVSQQAEFLPQQHALCLFFGAIDDVPAGKRVGQMISLPAQIHQQCKHNQQNQCCAI